MIREKQQEWEKQEEALEKKSPLRKKWDGKPYYSLHSFLKETYGEKIYKVALDTGMTCPNRDGTLDTRGCIFCSRGGSGDFAVPFTPDAHHVTEQLQQGIQKLEGKKTGKRFIAYFQSYTNTYAPVEYLRRVYEAALHHSMVIGISIATRPDCLGEPVLALLEELQRKYPDKFIWVELGLQTIHEATAKFIRRGYSLPVFEQAVDNLEKIQIPVIVHIIIGLPGETKDMLYETICYIRQFPIAGVKLQLLHVLKGTDLSTYPVKTLEKEEYLQMVIHCLELLPADVVIHRVTGDGPKNLLLAPLWSADKRDVLNSLHRMMQKMDTWQGKHNTML